MKSIAELALSVEEPLASFLKLSQDAAKPWKQLIRFLDSEESDRLVVRLH